MNSKINIYSQDWCDMVFDDKNKEYGAYVLREKSGKRHFRSLIIATICFVLAISTPLILKKISPKVKEANVEVTTMTDIKMDKKEEKKKVAEEIKLPDVPLKNTIRYVPPVIKPDEEVPDDEVLLNQKQLNESTTAISIKDQKGVDEGGIDVADLDKGVESIVNDEEAPFDIVEDSPDFPGGDLARMKFLKDNLQYPKLAYETRIEGIVYVEFVVSKIGKISNVKVKRGIGGNCDEEAMRVVKMMPNWKPGRQNGEKVPVKFVLPVKFTLN